MSSASPSSPSLQQTERDFELLVVADGCTDDTAKVVRGVDDRRIRLFNLPKAPFFGYANRNIALREARGEFVAFAAHDDLLFPDHLAVLIEALESSGHEWGYSRPLWVSTDGVIVPSGTNLTLPDELDFFLTQANTIPASCVVYRRSCLDRYGYWPEDVPSARRLGALDEDRRGQRGRAVLRRAAHLPALQRQLAGVAACRSAGSPRSAAAGRRLRVVALGPQISRAPAHDRTAGDLRGDDRRRGGVGAVGPRCGSHDDGPAGVG